jgi:hypothetical protein
MMFVMLVAAIGLVVTGLLAIAYGIGVQLSTGNTLIIAGVIGVCTGAIMLGFWMTVRELKNISRRLAGGVPEARGEAMGRPGPAGAAMRDSAPAGGDFLAAEQAGGSGPFSPAAAPFAAAPPPPWQNEDVLRDHPIPEPMHPEPPPSASKPKRNLLFSSTSRKERERAQSRSGEPLPPDPLSQDLRSMPPIGPLDDPAEPPPPSFEDAWPKPERARPAEMAVQRRSRMPPTLAEANGGPTQPEDRPEVTVLKSGVVDGMAYSLYSDGSIEAQMPEGMMRFASIDELRAHLDQRL